jgi:ABC-type Fe3+ transport system substrate-binding protein
VNLSERFLERRNPVINKQSAARLSSLISVLWSLSLAPAFSAPLPQSTQEMLKTIKLDASILADIDKELTVPLDWVEKAKKEGRVRVQGTPGVAGNEKAFFAPFRERYPFIHLEYSGSGQQDRSVKTLMAYKSGRFLGEVIESVSGALLLYVEAKALEDLRNIPNWGKIPEGIRDRDGLWVGVQQNHWCMSYNTNLVKKDDLPKRWEDLLQNPKWKGGNLALGNRPTQWALQLWQVKGEKWTKNLLTRIFAELKPQLRKEGTNTLPEFVAVGEFHAVIPTMQPHAARIVSRGAPVGYHCPEPVPATLGESVLLKGAPYINAARIFVNWLLSKEGQIARFATYSSTPSHKDLQRKEFLPFAEEILGKEVSTTDPAFEQKVLANLNEFWNDLWMRGASAR